MSRWSRSYDLYRESRPTPAGDSGMQISRTSSGNTNSNTQERARDVGPEGRPGPTVTRPAERQDLPLRDFAHLITSERPQLLSHGGKAYRLTGQQVRTLATIGAFRAIPRDDVIDRRLLSKADLANLRAQGLVYQRSISLHGEMRAIVTLTNNARRMLDAHRSHDHENDGQGSQPLHSGLVKPAELSHDAHLYALYEVAASDLAAQGATITHVQLDYTLKHDYQQFLNRKDRDPSTSLEEERRAWAEAHGLTLVDGELHLPDLRIEYTDAAAGELHTHDVELVTVHYSARSIAAKRAAGFALYRKGFTPRPNLFERLL
jgi:hypothetical protein